ncbi:Set4p KNAG_0B01690 [Huiozyma naganishii CBS 8797]|uniref:SET domain-containing protein n=1 Tax=Huiozyma naganishii (strain ATCC MYA-139 / BCRC 22969 / CBS 8797 / KCTC 17520 / NBRC 10181 / NCYC 3082 / Yp74L-3) TaxID=1071383 RepID=J7RGE4_HUIN7|nr:hypothetical protein KNAG_0B01690 [Kazachstania naganishii CBS 8797]CCK68613.1 hypothetical protein KNAG_0B01690 [Kazachstania naganishii CBS 8797]
MSGSRAGETQVKLLEVREQIQQQLSQAMRDSSLFNPLISPGPASITLLQENNGSDSAAGVSLDSGDATPRMAGSTFASASVTPPSGETRDAAGATECCKRGLVAAAALSLAVTRPLPHKRNSVGGVGGATAVVPKRSNELACCCGISGTIHALDMSDLVQCNHCHRWQHIACYGLKSKLEILPIKFYCNVCQPGLAAKNYKVAKKLGAKKRGKSLVGTVPLGQTALQSHSPKQQLHRSDSVTTTVSDSRTSSPKNLNLPIFHQTQQMQSPQRKHSGDHTPAEELDDNNDYEDKYVKMFIQDHADDDWVLPLREKPPVVPQDEILETRGAQSGVYAKRAFKRDEFISQIAGLVDFQKKYIVNPDNQYRIWGTAQPKVFFHPHWPVCIDSRGSSYDGVAINNIRRSCHPNVKLQTVKLPTTETRVDFMVTAIDDINPGDELLINWEWDLRHPICRSTQLCRWELRDRVPQRHGHFLAYPLH